MDEWAERMKEPAEVHNTVYYLAPSDEERRSIRELLVEIAADKSNLDEEVFLRRVALFAHQLPLRIRETFYQFKLRELWPILVVHHNPIAPEDVGPTPLSHWRPGEYRPLTLGQLLHGLYSTLLGEVFGFDTQQRGRVFNDLISIPGSPESSSSGAGRVGLHTEDAYKPFLPDYLGLACLRNTNGAATTLSCIEALALSDAIRRTLFEESVIARDGTKHYVLFGDADNPYLQYGPLIDAERCSTSVKTAFEALGNALRDHQQSIILRTGDCLYVDNFRAVHGRLPFSAEYGQGSRWFCRLLVTRDLRRTRNLRSAPDARVVVTEKPALAKAV